MTDLLVDPEPTAPRRSLVPILLGVGAVVALLVGVFVVLGDDDEATIDDPVALISSAPDAAREAGTARMTMRTEMSGDGMSVDMNGEGLVDFVTGATSFEMSMMGMSFEMRMLDSTMYMRMPGVVELPGGAEWIAMPITIAGNALGGPMTPGGTGFLDSLRAVSSDIEALGTSDVNGVEAHGYRFVIDVTAAMEQVPDQYREDVDAALSQLEGMGMSEMPTEVWVTDGGLPVREVITMTSSLFDMELTMDWTDFGVDVDIEAPPADTTLTVTDQRELETLLGGVAG
jgi:hypothetical protein